MISYEKFWALCSERVVSTYWLRKNGIGAPTVTKLQQRGNIDTVTIDKLCRLLECQPGDIMEYKLEHEAEVQDEQDKD